MEFFAAFDKTNYHEGNSRVTKVNRAKGSLTSGFVIADTLRFGFFCCGICKYGRFDADLGAIDDVQYSCRVVVAC